MVRCKFTMHLNPYKQRGKKRQVSRDSGLFSYKIEGLLPTTSEMNPELRRAVRFHLMAMRTLTEELKKSDLLSYARVFSEVRNTVSMVDYVDM